MKLFEMKHIKKSFGALDVLRDISLEVDKGEVLSIIVHPVRVSLHCFAVPLVWRPQTAAKSSKTEKSDWFSRILTFFPIFL